MADQEAQVDREDTVDREHTEDQVEDFTADREEIDHMEGME